MKMEEQQTGCGYGGIVYLPWEGETVPALMIGLRRNQFIGTAIAQIKRKKYPEVFQSGGDDILTAKMMPWGSKNIPVPAKGGKTDPAFRRCV